MHFCLCRIFSSRTKWPFRRPSLTISSSAVWWSESFGTWLQRWYDAPRDFVGCNMFQARLQQKKLSSRVIDSAWWWLLFLINLGGCLSNMYSLSFTPKHWGDENHPIWRAYIFFRWVETTNQHGLISWNHQPARVILKLRQNPSETETKRSSKN